MQATTVRLRSKKMRILQEALGASAEDIARKYAASHHTYAEIAAEWQRRVIAVFPEFAGRFVPSDVFHLFSGYGIQRRGLTGKTAADDSDPTNSAEVAA